jgi:hypothetical protein
MQEDPDGEHQENVLATGMVANARPRDNMTKTTRRQTEAALFVSACIALCESQPEKSEATSDDEADPAHACRLRVNNLYQYEDGWHAKVNDGRPSGC